MSDEYKPLNLYTNFYDCASKFPDTNIYFDEQLPAFPELGLQTTYAKAHSAILNKAFRLKELGIKKGDKVIVYKSPKFDTYMLGVALSYLAAIPAMLSDYIPVDRMKVLNERLENPFILYDDVTAQKCKELNTGKLIHINELSVAPKNTYAQDTLETNEIAYLTHTSGTTGIPKLIAHSANSMGYRIQLQRNVLNEIDNKKGLLAFHISPVHSRFNIGICSLMCLGFEFMPIANIKKDNILAVMEKFQPYAFETHPNNLVQLGIIAKKYPQAFSSIKYLHSTFDAINKGTMEIFLNCSKHKDPIFLQIYGQSECGPTILKEHTRESIKNWNAREMGIGYPGLTQARVVDEKGNITPPNTKGNIHFNPKGLAVTYYKEEPRWNENLYGDWWDTGDYGIMDENGVLYLYDRQVDLIENVESNLAIEDILLDKHEFLDEVVIVRDKDGKPQPVISVAEGHEMDWDAWWASIENMPYLNKPIVMPFDNIPRTATMKVQRLRLEEELKDVTQ